MSPTFTERPGRPDPRLPRSDTYRRSFVGGRVWGREHTPRVGRDPDVGPGYRGSGVLRFGGGVLVVPVLSSVHSRLSDPSPPKVFQVTSDTPSPSVTTGPSSPTLVPLPRALHRTGHPDQRPRRSHCLNTRDDSTVSTTTSLPVPGSEVGLRPRDPLQVVPRLPQLFHRDGVRYPPSPRSTTRSSLGPPVPRSGPRASLALPVRLALPTRGHRLPSRHGEGTPQRFSVRRGVSGGDPIYDVFDGHYPTCRRGFLHRSRIGVHEHLHRNEP